MSYLKVASILVLVAVCASCCAAVAADDELASLILQDFEQGYVPDKYPASSPGNVVLSSDWKASGASSLKIDAGLMTAVEDMKTHDWSGYSLLRVHVMNPQKTAVTVGFELADALSKDYWDRHQNAFGVQPGEQVIDLQFGQGICRSETNRPYRGSVKTPIELKAITRFAFTNHSAGPIYIDKVELVRVKALETPGGFAFDFGVTGKQVMGQFIGIFQDTLYSTAKGFGLLGRASGLTPMIYPTPMLGDGLALPGDGFRVDLPGGDYLGWIAFERGGFWEGEGCAYEHATLKVNGTVVHEHDFMPAGIHFLFQDTEITDISQIADRIIWPAQAINSFKFKAAKGANVFTLDVRNSSGTPLRIAGLIVAPDTTEGKAFIAAHEKLQRSVIARTFAPEDKGRRGEGRVAPPKDIVVEPLALGEMVFPHDWPTQAGLATTNTEVSGLAGQIVALHFGVYARKDLNVTVIPGKLEGPAELPSPVISYGRYMPGRHETGTAWLEVNHYRPESAFTVGPELTRSVLVEYEIPSNAQSGVYSGTLKIAGDTQSLSIPIKLTVISMKLPEIPIPVGLLMNTLPFDANSIDSDTWWKLQEDVIREQVRAGLNTLTGGPGIAFNIDSAGNVSGNNALRLVKIAQKYGSIKALVSYGGFLPNIPDAVDRKVLATKLKAFEEANQLPPSYFNCYDEPLTFEERTAVLQRLLSNSTAGLRTFGFTSAHFGDALWEKMIGNTLAVAVCIHEDSDIAKLKAAGKQPWVYNNGASRYSLGLNLLRSIRQGIEGRLEWIGMYTQGFAFNNLDGREPSYGCFLVHQKLGVLKTPMWLSAREGLLDTRLRLALEKATAPDDAVLKLWDVSGSQSDRDKWSNAEMDRVRNAMLKRLEELKKK